MVCLDAKTMRDSHPTLCRPYESVLTLECFYFLQQSATLRTCNLGQISPGAAHFWPKMGGQLGRRCCGWLKIPCTIPTPGFIIHVCESISTLEWFCSSLQSFAHLIWARVALKFSNFGQLWGLAWHFMVCLNEKAMYNSHPRLYKPCQWTNFDFGMLLQQSATICTCHLGQISPVAARFWPN